VSWERPAAWPRRPPREARRGSAASMQIVVSCRHVPGLAVAAAAALSCSAAANCSWPYMS
jgi:hypothetical protein